LSNIEENTVKITEKTKKVGHDIGWIELKGLRNRIAHGYTGIDYEMIFDIVKSDVPEILNPLEKLTAHLLENGVFSKEELSVAEKSKYYKNVRFDFIVKEN
jgi:uncharacterized protein with HEPN domain